MANITNVLHGFSNFLQNHHVSFTNGLLILFTVGGEQIFRFTAFQCPSSQPQARLYACCFMFGPAIILGILGVMVNNLTWRLCHGCKHRSAVSALSCREILIHNITIFARGCLVPGAWLFITLLDGNSYVCMMSDSPTDKGLEENKRYLAQSQIISWFSLVGVVIIVSLVICSSRCTDSVTYHQNKYIVTYREAEEKRLGEFMMKAADEKAKSNVAKFMEDPDRKKDDWDEISKAQDIKLSMKEPPIGPSSCSVLDKWCQKESNRSQVEITGNQQQTVV